MRPALFLLLSLALGASAQDEPVDPLMTPARAHCAVQAFQGYTGALVRLQQDNGRRLAARRADFAPMARQAARVEASRAELALMRVRHLEINAPHRLHVNRGLAALGEVDWSAQDEAVLRTANPAYGKLADGLAREQAQLLGHPRRAAFERFAEQWLATPEYQGAVQGFSTQMLEAEKALNACTPPAQRRPGDRIP